MPSMNAYLDDFGKITVWMNPTFYNGKSDHFHLLDEMDMYVELPIRQVETTHEGTYYTLSAPKDIEFGKRYRVRESHGLSVFLQHRMVVKTEEFNRRFFYSGNDLGCTYHKMHSSFALWAPTAITVLLRLTWNGRLYTYPMERTEHGVFRKNVIGDLKNATYLYIVECNGQFLPCTDPYSLSANGNARESAVIDLAEVEKEPKVSVKGISGTDAVIYEVSVRDATSSFNTGTKAHGTFNALTEEGTSYKGMPTGLDHIKSLGVTHVQLLPVMDFATVNEFHPDKSYNWGYDPAHYLVPEGSYSSNPEDPYARMKELRRLVAVMHKNNIRVNLDVVFNHLYNTDFNCFQCSVPYYYERYNRNARQSNGSFCGNDFDSNQPMARKFIVQCILKMIEIYDIDGLRFDLMGILDIATMNTIRETCIALNPDFMVYGEGWDLPTALDWEKKAQIANQQRMPHIGHFNDRFRDVIKGKTGDGDRYDRGYATGDLGKSYDVLSALAAHVLPTPFHKIFETPDQSINGPETHDNNTLWDKMHFCCNNDNRATRRRRQRLMIGMTMAAQGVPFLHAGVEFCATKNDNGNTYNAGDAFNQLDWERADFNRDTIEYTIKAVALRKKYRHFRMKTAQDIAKHAVLKTIDGGTIFYDINLEDADTGVNHIRVIINASGDDRFYTFQDGWKVIFNESGDAEQEPVTEYDVPYLSMIVLAR